MRGEDSNHKGNLAEAVIAAEAVRLGIDVLRPITEHARYDLVFDLGGALIRVQCKWAPRRGDVVAISLTGFRYTSNGAVRTTYAVHEIDAVAVYCDEVERCYLLPAEVVDGMHALHLRLAPPRNGQIAALNWATDFEFAGAVAQLGERRRGTAEATGSSPVSSISATEQSRAQVGAHEFRNRFGWYMERAAAGEEILVTRRGKPTVRLVGVVPQPPLPTPAEGGESPPADPSVRHDHTPAQ